MTRLGRGGSKDAVPRRGAEDEWEEEPTTAEVGRPPTVVFSIRFGTDDLRLMKDRADRDGVRVSELVRRAVVAYLRGSTAPNVNVVAPVLRVHMYGSEPARTHTEAVMPSTPKEPAYTGVRR